jgi:DNA recombination protein RmuC
MDQILFNLGGFTITPSVLVIVVLVLALSMVIRKPNSPLKDELADALAQERQRDLEDKLSALLRVQAELNGRMAQMGEAVDSKHGHLTRMLNERLEGLQARLGEGMTAHLTTTHDNLSKLNERLTVIDEAQKRMGLLTSEMLSLKDILSNKQSRGAFGQGRMEAIVRDSLPPSAYEFQATLANGKRPDCIIRLPGDPRPLIVDAKFPLEGFTAFREAQSDEAKKAAIARVKTDIATHIRDISEKYLTPGLTQDIAILFVPAESLYADLQEHFEDVVQRAHRARVLIVSPSLLMMAIQVMQAIVRDSKMREQAHQIQDEVRRLLEDVGRLRDRVAKLDTHFRQSQDDVAQITISADKVLKRGEKIDAMDFEGPATLPSSQDERRSASQATTRDADLTGLIRGASSLQDSETLPSPLNRSRNGLS